MVGGSALESNEISLKFSVSELICSPIINFGLAGSRKKRWNFYNYNLILMIKIRKF
jgi:hypothetical protein